MKKNEYRLFADTPSTLMDVSGNDIVFNHHIEDLKKSGLSDDTIKQAGFKSKDRLEAMRILKIESGFVPPNLKDILIIPFPGTGYMRFKIFYEGTQKGKKQPKYLQPKNTPPRLFVPEEIRPVLQDPSIPLEIVEGEKKALKVAQEGMPVIGLAGLWCWANEGRLLSDFDAIALKGRTVTICPDNDWRTPNRHGYKRNLESAVNGLANKLTERGATVFIRQLPPGPLKGPDDYLCKHPAEDYKELSVLGNAAIIEFFNQTDVGNAKRLIAHHGQNIRYNYTSGKWLTWKGNRWLEDNTDEIKRLAKETVKKIYQEATETADKEERKKIVAHAIRSENTNRLDAMIKEAKSEPDMVVASADLDRAPWLFNVQNGTIDLKTGKLYPHRRSDLITQLVPVDYDPEAKCPLWESFLNKIMGGKKDLIRFLQLAIGYSLTGLTTEQVLFILWGSGSNGKTTLLNILQAFFGDYARRTGFTTFLNVRNNDGKHNDIAALVGSRLVFASESKAGGSLNETVIKEITGGDPISVRFLYKEFFTYTPTYKLWLSTNHKPWIQGADHAIWRRMRLIPFEVRISDEEADRALPQKLMNELSGILNWAVNGCLSWQKEGLIVPEEVRSATEEYRCENDVFLEFLEEHCEPDKTSEVSNKQLYGVYWHWCSENKEHPLSRRAFGLRLRERGFEQRKSNGNRIWIGLRLKNIF